MRFGVLGTGMVGTTIASKLAALGHEVCMGSRTRENPSAAAWAATAGAGARAGTFADAAGFGELVFNCTAGTASVDVVRQAGPERFAGKVLIDVANRLQMTATGPQLVIGEISLGEELQQTVPEARVVKTLNTINHQLMVDPSLVPGSHDVFVCGDDAEAKAQVVSLLVSFGWPREDIVDLGGIASARAVELYIPLWIRLWQINPQAPQFNIKVVRSGEAQ